MKPVKVPPNLADYESGRAGFSWDAVTAELAGLPDGGGVNLAHEAVDRHPDARREALRWLGEDGRRRVYTYADLRAQSNRFANVLTRLGVRRGDRVAVLTGRIPELYLAALGAWKAGAVFCPLFSAFGPEPIFQRLSRGDVRFLVTTERFYRRKVKDLRPRLPALEHVLLTETLPDALNESSPEYRIPPTDPEEMATLHFTSGTTGMPKGAVHVHDAVRTHLATGRYALDLREGDVFWCTADPGWVTGTSYGILAPLLHGVTMVVDEADFEIERWRRILEEERVSVWYTSPTALRMLMRAGQPPWRLEALRFAASVGEPLNPEVVHWSRPALGVPVHDNWWQTETGGIMIANLPCLDIRPGSMGKPLPGVEAGIVRRTADGAEEVATPGAVGELALRPGWPSMFRGYLHDEERYRRCFAGGWYLTGDLARRDEDGYFWFVGRGDDIIKTAGHMVGPFEVESALMEHPAVAEAAVIGKPDPMIGEVVMAFLVTRPGFEPTEALRTEVLGFARGRLGSAVAPKEIRFLGGLPRTRSGKIMRRLLKARELGLPEGDLSTLEEDAKP